MAKPPTAISKAETMDREIRATCAVLESVAKKYPSDSPEHEAIREAAFAFGYLRMHKSLRESYQSFRKHCDKPLRKSTKQTLKRMGVTA